MPNKSADRDFAVTGFQVGLRPACVGVHLVLCAEGADEPQQLIIRLTASMAETLASHLHDASVAVAMGVTPTEVRQ